MVGRSARLPSGALSQWLGAWNRGEPQPVYAAPLPKHALHVLSFAGLAIAALAAALVVVLRADPQVQQPAPQFAVSLPGIGIGAPADLGEEAGGGPVLALSHLDDPEQSRAGLTGRRYAAHLVGEIVDAPERFAAPLRNADQVIATIVAAQRPELILAEPREAATSSEPIDDAVLRVRLGVDADDPLPPFVLYTVQRGDTVAKLAQRFGLQTQSILFNNWEIRDPERLEPGTQITVPAKDGVVYTVRLGDTLLEVAQNYASEVADTLAFEGNNLPSPDRLVEGATILLVGGSASAADGGSASAAGSAFAIPDFRWPMGGILTDFFGTPRGNRFGFHTGIDLSAPTGTYIGSAAPGIVIQAGWDGSFGLSVLVDHGGGVLTRYSHLSHIDVFLGEWVDPGGLIGFVGSSGLSSGPHLHFEILMGGVPVDPLVWLNS